MSNLVSWAQIDVHVPVQIVVQRAELLSGVPLPDDVAESRGVAIDAGSGVLLTATFAGSAITNWSMPDQRFGRMDPSE